MNLSTVDISVMVGVALLGYGYFGVIGAGWALVSLGFIIGALLAVFNVEV